MKRLNIILFIILIIIAGIMIALFRYKAHNQPLPNKYPVFFSVKYSTVNVRTGPGKDFPQLWTYKIKRTPIKAIAKYKDWYQIVDYSGKVGWIAESRVTTSNGAFITVNKTLVYDEPNLQAKVNSSLSNNIMILVRKCKNDFCKIQLNINNISINGWVKKANLWGVN